MKNVKPKTSLALPKRAASVVGDEQRGRGVAQKSKSKCSVFIGMSTYNWECPRITRKCAFDSASKQLGGVNEGKAAMAAVA